MCYSEKKTNPYFYARIQLSANTVLCSPGGRVYIWGISLLHYMSFIFLFLVFYNKCSNVLVEDTEFYVVVGKDT